MKRTMRANAGLMSVALALGITMVLRGGSAAQSQERRRGVPVFEVDPFWPKPLPNNWTFGEFSGIAVDSHDHVWINQRPKTLADDEKYLTARQATAARPGRQSWSSMLTAAS